jgi:hypothetical protein
VGWVLMSLKTKMAVPQMSLKWCTSLVELIGDKGMQQRHLRHG